MERKKRFFIAALGLLLGGIFMIAGGGKLFGQEAQIDSFFRWGYPFWFLYLIGAIELMGGMFLFIPQFRYLAALVLSITMVGAFITHFRSGEMEAVPVPILLLVVLLIFAWLTWPSSRKDCSGSDLKEERRF